MLFDRISPFLLARLALLGGILLTLASHWTPGRWGMGPMVVGIWVLQCHCDRPKSALAKSMTPWVLALCGTISLGDCVFTGRGRALTPADHALTVAAVGLYALLAYCWRRSVTSLPSAPTASF